MHILIIGSEGFIGSNAVRYFRAKGYKVTCADIVLKEEEGYILINPETPDFSSLFNRRQYDVCINATGAANVQFSFSYPYTDYTLNVANVYAILDTVRVYNKECKVINLSSAAVYGNPAKLPISEDAFLNPLSPYGYHKMYSEQICKEFYELFNMPTISLRIFSAYGEGLQKQLFWDIYKKMSLQKTAIEMFGTGKESRDFIYIEDLVSAIECIMLKAVFNGTAINVASGIESTIEEATGYFVKAINKDISVKFTGNSKIGDPLNWRADISLLKSIGFINRFTLEAGINNYCTWIQEKRSL